jgi:hypothetical protein
MGFSKGMANTITTTKKVAHFKMSHLFSTFFFTAEAQRSQM